MIRQKLRAGFTIVELIVVITVIAILAGIVVVSYGAWRTSTATASLKSDLANAASAMESKRTFSGSYPLSLSDISSTFTASTNNTILLSVPGASGYCLDGTTTIDSGVVYYIDDVTQKNGATQGTCAGRTIASAPIAVSNVQFTAGSTQINVSWDLGAPNYATQHLVQCAADSAFIFGLLQATVGATATTHSLTGASSSTSYFCRVRAVNTNGQSAWSSPGQIDTQAPGCGDTNQYGIFPDCYDYDALPIASSIEGYWTTAPAGYLLEDGSAVSRTTYAELFAVIGTTFGAGNGSTTFNLPDSRGRTAVNISSTDAEFNTIGELSGTRTETLTIAQMPSHTHLVPWLASGSNVNDYLGGSTALYGLAQTYASRTGTYDMLEPIGGGGAHNNVQPSIVKTFAIKFRPSTGTTSKLPAGTSIDGYWSTAPTGYLLEDGAAVSRTTYSDLFAVTGTTHGAGNGTTTFNLPDSRGRIAVNISSTDSEFNTMGELSGSKTETLTTAQMPSHTHRVPWQDNGSDVSDYLGGSTASYGMSSSFASRSGSYDMIEPVGGGGSHNNIQPSIVRRSAIKHTPAAGAIEAAATGTSIEGYWTTIPTGYLAEDGSAVSRTTYAALFAVIGTTHGVGNGSTTFNLPDSRGRTAVNLSSVGTEFNAMGKKYGEKANIITTLELPSHTHRMPWQDNGSDVSDYLGGSNAIYGLALSWASRTGALDMLQASGSGGSHNEIQPSIVKQFAIKF